jgi:hypothetical protein
MPVSGFKLLSFHILHLQHPPELVADRRNSTLPASCTFKTANMCAPDTHDAACYRVTTRLGLAWLIAAQDDGRWVQEALRMSVGRI